MMKKAKHSPKQQHRPSHHKRGHPTSKHIAHQPARAFSSRTARAAPVHKTAQRNFFAKPTASSTKGLKKTRVTTTATTTATTTTPRFLTAAALQDAFKPLALIQSQKATFTTLNKTSFTQPQQLKQQYKQLQHNHHHQQQQQSPHEIAMRHFAAPAGSKKGGAAAQKGKQQKKKGGDIEEEEGGGEELFLSAGDVKKQLRGWLEQILTSKPEPIPLPEAAQKNEDLFVKDCQTRFAQRLHKRSRHEQAKIIVKQRAIQALPAELKAEALKNDDALWSMQIIQPWTHPPRQRWLMEHFEIPYKATVEELEQEDFMKKKYARF